VLKNHPRSDESRPLTGVFYTRSPARPNPLGLHPVTVREIDGTRVKIGPTNDRYRERVLAQAFSAENSAREAESRLSSRNEIDC